MYDLFIIVRAYEYVISIIVIASFLSYVIIRNDVFIKVLICLIHVFAFIAMLFIIIVDDEFVTFIRVDITLIFDDFKIIINVFYEFMFETHFYDLNQHFNLL